MRWITEARLYAVWAAIGPLGGIVIGAWLAAHWQRKKWILDNKAAEYRGIFDALNVCRRRLFHYQAMYGPDAIDQDAEGRQLDDQVAMSEGIHLVVEALSDRIFIRKAVVRSGVIKDFQIFYHTLLTESPPDMKLTSQTLAELHLRLLRMAWEDLGLGKRIPFSKAQTMVAGATGDGQTNEAGTKPVAN